MFSPAFYRDAVLPIQNLKDAADPEQYGRILQELIITDLSGLASLKVLSSQRLFDVQKQVGGGDPAKIDRELATEVARRAGASRMLTGSLSRLGNRWILTSQLVNLSDGAVVNSEKIDGTDLYAMVDRLTSRISDGLGVVTTAHAGIGLAVNEKTSSSLDAYQHYLRGVDHLNRREYDDAVAALEQALEVDPAFDQVRYKLAIARWWADDDSDWFQPGGEPDLPAHMMEELLAAGARLSTKEKRLAEAFVPLLRRRYEQAQPLFRRLVRDFPDEKEAWYGLGEALYHVDRGHEDLEAADAFARALQLDPSFRLGFDHVLQIYDSRGMHEAAVRLTRELLEKNPDDPSWYRDWIRAVGGRASSEDNTGLLDDAVAEALENVTDPELRTSLLMRVAHEYRWELGDLDKSESYFLQAADIAGERKWEVLERLGWLYTERGDRSAAERVYRQALQEKPRRPSLLGYLFDLLGVERRYDEIIDMSRAMIDEAPGELPPYHYWVEAAVRKGDEDQARRVLERGLARAASDADRRWLWRHAGQTFGLVGNHIGAEEFFERAAGTTGGDEDAILQGAHAWNLFELRRFEAAEQTYREALGLHSEYGNARNGLRIVCRTLGKHEESIALGKDHRDRARRFPWVNSVYVDSLAHAGRMDEAERALEEGLEFMRTDAHRKELLVWVAQTARAVGESELADRLIERAAAIDVETGRAEFHATRAYLAVDAGRYDEAEVEFRKTIAMVVYPDLTYSLELAALNLLRGRPAEAERQLRELFAQGSGDRGIHLGLAQALIEQGQFADALPFAERCVAMNPDRKSLEILAWILVAGDIDVERGIETARRALDTFISPWDAKLARPYEPPAEHTLGLAHLKRGRRDEAVRWLDKAAEVRPDRSSIREHLESR